MLRIGFTNANQYFVGLFLVGVVASAFFIGLIYGNKAWCQYLCPVGLVQSILAGENVLIRKRVIGLSLSLGPPSCLNVERTSFENLCKSCISNSIDVNNPQHSSNNLKQSSDVSFIWLSYPGFVALILVPP